jgi:hypothetical protein
LVVALDRKDDVRRGEERDRRGGWGRRRDGHGIGGRGRAQRGGGGNRPRRARWRRMRGGDDSLEEDFAAAEDARIGRGSDGGMGRMRALMAARMKSRGGAEERERVRVRRGEDGRGADGAEETEAMASVAERKALVAERRGRRQRLAEQRTVDAYSEFISSSRD